jgi:hypothetical protein
MAKMRCWLAASVVMVAMPPSVVVAATPEAELIAREEKQFASRCEVPNSRHDAWCDWMAAKLRRVNTCPYIPSGRTRWDRFSWGDCSRGGIANRRL